MAFNHLPAQVIPLWPPDLSAEAGEPLPEQETFIPAPFNLRAVHNVSRPTLSVFRPDPAQTNRRTGLIICPGGGYHFHTIDSEGLEVARWLTERGITAFILKYRLIPTERQPEAFVKQMKETLWDRLKQPEVVGPALAAARADGQQAMTLVLASLSLFGLGIFGPGIATGLVSGAPQLGAGAAVGVSIAARSISVSACRAAT